MTYAGFPVLYRYLQKTSQSLNESFPLEKILSRKYDRRCVPAKIKSGLTIGKFSFFVRKDLKKVNIYLNAGMAMTEKQGGSDVRSNTTKAYCDNKDEKRYVLIGHKYVMNRQRERMSYMKINYS